MAAPEQESEPEHIPWARRNHQIFETQLLTSEDPRAARPEGFQGNLWAPQATTLAHMLAVEDRPVLRLEAGPAAPLLKFRCARIAEKFSFGKTVLCVALVCASRTPRAYPSDLNVLTMDNNPKRNRYAISEDKTPTSYQFRKGGRGVLPTLSLRYQRIIRATLVVVGASVVSHWEDCIRTYAPHLKFITIDAVHALRKFHTIFKDSPAEMDEIHIVLLKAGKVTTSFVVEGEPKPETRTRTLTSAIRIATEGHVWGRVIIDDYDTLRLDSGDTQPPALFTWVISATSRRSSTTLLRTCAPAPTVEEFIQRNTPPPVLAISNDCLYDHNLMLR